MNRRGFLKTIAGTVAMAVAPLALGKPVGPITGRSSSGLSMLLVGGYGAKPVIGEIKAGEEVLLKYDGERFVVDRP